MNETVVLAAWLKIARADTGAGGLVILSGRTSPLLPWGDRQLADLEKPALAVQFVTSVFRDGAPPRKQMLFRVDATAPFGAADGIIGSLLDRLEAITTQPAFSTEAIDTGVRPGVRRGANDLQPGGWKSIEDFTFDVTV